MSWPDALFGGTLVVCITIVVVVFIAVTLGSKVK
jgi:hypothetical protein